MSAEVQKFMVTETLEQGRRIERPDALEISEKVRILQSVVDYRGDVTLEFKSGDRIEAFVFNYDQETERLDYFQKGSSQPGTCKVAALVSIEVSGVDTAKGKSWEDYQARKREEELARNQAGGAV